jgi:hypothetical protein
VVCRSARAQAAFCLAVALTAAALVGPLVEYLADAGAFGHQSFTDRSNADVLPALCIGGLVAAALVLALARRLVRPSAAVPSWAREAAEATRISRSQMLATFGMQIAVLFVMETCEQIAIWGHPLGGTIKQTPLTHDIARGLVLHYPAERALRRLRGRAPPQLLPAS